MGWGEACLGKRFLGRSDLVQSCLPAALKFRGDETIVGVDPVELPFGQSGGVPPALELAFRAGAQAASIWSWARRALDSASSSAGASAVRNASATAASMRAARMCWQVGRPSLERRWLHTYWPPPL